MVKLGPHYQDLKTWYSSQLLLPLARLVSYWLRRKFDDIPNVCEDKSDTRQGCKAYYQQQA